MKINYLPYSKAAQLVEDNQHLKGSPLEDGCFIDFIVVAPYSRIIQWSFVTDLLRGAEPEAQRFTTNDRYNAIVVARCPNALAGFLIKDLRAYLKGPGLNPVPDTLTANDNGK